MQGLAYSRPSAVAVKLLRDPTAGQLLARPVLLTADLSAIQTLAGRSVFLAAVSLLTRFCADLSICVPKGPGPFGDDVRTLANRVHHAGSITFVEASELNIESYCAVLNVGQTQSRELPWTTIACDGWALQVCSTGCAANLGFAQFNPATTLAVASLGATEVFKRLLGVKSSMGPLLENEVFSLLTYTIDDDPGPEIRGPIRLDCLLAGAGAIGNGIRHVLQELPLEGWLAIVDRQTAGEENWGTYIDLDPTGFGKRKAELASLGWGTNVRVFPLSMDVCDLVAVVGAEFPFSELVLGGVDNIEARHAIQQLWPTVAIDGAIGDITCQVSRHPWGPDTACLRCLFREPSGEDALVVASRMTGLTIESASRQDDVVSQADIDGATGEHKAFLAARSGQLKCSVIREALAAALSANKASFSPSAPFIACLSASMVAGEFIKTRNGLNTPLDPRFQFNVLMGPSRGVLLSQGRSPDCFCATRGNAIESWRAWRKQTGIGCGQE